MNEYTKLTESIIDLINEIKSIKAIMTVKNERKLYTNKEMLSLLQVNTSTLRRYRDEGKLGYSKIGDKYFYSLDDLNRFLTTNHFEPFAN